MRPPAADPFATLAAEVTDSWRRLRALVVWPGFETPAPVVDEPADADLPVMAEIHAGAFGRGWSVEEIADLLAAPGVTGLVARRASPFGTRGPVGFLIARAAADEAEILTVAVLPAWRSRGVGRSLLEAALRRLYADRVGPVFLEVDAGNAPAVALYRRQGFRQVAERRGYYEAGAGDDAGLALVMRLDLQ